MLFQMLFAWQPNLDCVQLQKSSILFVVIFSSLFRQCVFFIFLFFLKNQYSLKLFQIFYYGRTRCSNTQMSLIVILLTKNFFSKNLNFREHKVKALSGYSHSEKRFRTIILLQFLKCSRCLGLLLKKKVYFLKIFCCKFLKNKNIFFVVAQNEKIHT